MTIGQTQASRFTEGFIGNIPFSGIFIEDLEAGENITALEICYIETDGKAHRLDSTMTTKLNLITVMALETLTIGQKGRFLVNGVVENSSWSFTPGYVIIVPPTKGEGITEAD